MLRSLAAKAIVPVALSVTGFVAVCCILLYTGLRDDMIRDTVQHETNLADTIIQAGRHAMLQSDREALSAIVRDIGIHEGVEHVRIFNKKGLVMFSSRPDELHRFVDKQAEGCIGCHSSPTPLSTLGPMQQARRFVNERGSSVLAITAPIPNEPDCYTADCHYHTRGQKLLGTLDVGLSEQPLQKTLLSLRRRMEIFTAMVLVLTVGGVAALLRRSVLLPIQRLSEFTQEVAGGNPRGEPPRVSGQVGDLAAAFQRMAEELQRARDEAVRLRGAPAESGPASSDKAA